MDALAVDSLTDRQQRFVFEYLKDQNASAAAERAGYSARSRASQAGVLMGMPAVRECIRIEMASLMAELRLSALDLMKERMRAAFFRAGKLFDASGRLLGFEEMEVEVRDSLVISGGWGKGDPLVRFRQPNREPALRALERVHERLEKLNEAHYAALEKERWSEAPLPAAPGAGPPEMWAPLNLHEAGPAQAAEGGGQAVAPVVESTQAASVPDSAENSQGFSGSANTTVVQTPVQAEEGGGRGGTPGAEPAAAAPAQESAEISQVFSGSPAPPAKPSVFAKALAVLKSEKKEAPIKRRDPNLLWGGTPKSVVVEPSPALAEHLARIRHEELNAEVKREMELRGGKIKPGTLRPPGTDPGYNPPWLRDNRPRFAVGAGEFYFSGEEPEA